MLPPPTASAARRRYLTPPRCPRCTTSGGVQAAASLAAATVVSPAAASALVSIHASRLASDTLPLFRDIDYFHCLSSQTWQDYWLDAISVCLARGRGRIGSEIARTDMRAIVVFWVCECET
jgi:hypothetical protein